MTRRSRVYIGHESARMSELQGLPFASFAARAGAFAIDTLIACVTFVGLFVGAVELAGAAGWLPEHAHVHFEFNPFDHESWQSLIYFVLFIALSNYIGNGATIGKKVIGIRAVSLVHHRLSLWHSFERALGYGASALEGFFGFFQYFIHPNRRTVHDRIAETIVISERARRKQLALPEVAETVSKHF